MKATVFKLRVTGQLRDPPRDGKPTRVPSMTQFIVLGIFSNHREGKVQQYQWAGEADKQKYSTGFPENRNLWDERYSKLNNLEEKIINLEDRIPTWKHRINQMSENMTRDYLITLSVLMNISKVYIYQNWQTI